MDRDIRSATKAFPLGEGVKYRFYVNNIRDVSIRTGDGYAKTKTFDEWCEQFPAGDIEFVGMLHQTVPYRFNLMSTSAATFLAFEQAKTQAENQKEEYDAGKEAKGRAIEVIKQADRVHVSADQRKQLLGGFFMSLGLAQNDFNRYEQARLQLEDKRGHKRSRTEASSIQLIDD